MTRKPCPGCGKSDRQRRVDEVCHDCATAIKNWNAYVTRVKDSPEGVHVTLKGAIHWYPRLYSLPHRTNKELDEVRHDLDTLFPAFGEHLCSERLSWGDSRGVEALEMFPARDVRRPLEKGQQYRERVLYPVYKGEGSNRESVALIDKASLEFLQALFDRTARYGHLSYLAGVADGRDLLMQLAAGEITGAELAERDMRLAKQTQDARYLHEALTNGDSSGEDEL